MLLPKLLIQLIEGNWFGHKLRGAESKTLSLFNSTFCFYQYKSEFFKYIFVFLKKCFTKSFIYNCISSVIFVLFTRHPLSKKYLYSDVFLPLFPHTQTEHRNLLCKSPQISVFSPNTWKLRPETFRIQALFMAMFKTL